MGVRGLQTFLKKNPCVSQEINFTNSNLVIDANNLLCLLYCNLCTRQDSGHFRSDIYGGDMVAYSGAVREFFEALAKCEITPILVFDGSVIGKKSTRDQLMLKERTIYKRGLERFQAAKEAAESYPSEKLCLPFIITHVFKNVVLDMGIQKLQTPYEADTHIARIATELNCPVLTNDSDFIIYNLPQGFIMIDTFFYENILTRKDGKNCIQCYIFSQAKLIKSIPGLSSEVMPLLSVLLGNDYVETGTFDRVLDPILNRPYQGKLIAETWTHKKIANLLSWLQGKTSNESIECILNQLQAGSRDKLRQVIKILLQSYKIEQADVFEAELDEIYPPSYVDNMHLQSSELKPSLYLRRLFEKSTLSSTALDVIFHNTNYNYAVIDDPQLPSSSYVRYRPLSLAITLLRPRTYQGMTTYRRQIETDKDNFDNYDRIKGEYAKITLKPLEYLDGFGSLEHIDLYTTIALELGLRKSILSNVFRFNDDEMNLIRDTVSRVFKGDFVQESSLCLILIKYIGLETKLNPKPQFVDAIMLTLFYYAATNGKIQENLIQGPQLDRLLNQLKPHSIKNNGRQYSPSETLYRRIVHFISQLQVAYVSYCLVNTLLNDVFQTTGFEKFFNGTLVFRLTKLMRLGQLKLGDLCIDIPVLLDTCETVKVTVYCEE